PVGDRDTFVVLDRSAADAAEVAVLRQGPLVRCGTGAHLDAAVALAVAVGEVLGVGELVVLALGPAHAAQVRVVTPLGGCPAGFVGLPDLGEYGGVEPVEVGLVVGRRCVGRGPLAPAATLGVGRRCGSIT